MRAQRLILVGALMALLSLSAGPAARATVMVEVPLEDLIRGADAIVHGTVVRSAVRVAITDQGMEPRTFTTIRVTEWLKGNGEREVELDEFGGPWQGGDARIVGTPQYRPREEVIVFLERHPRSGRFRTYQMVQGKFHVVHGVPGVPTSVQRDLDAVGFAHWIDGQMAIQSHHQQPAMALDVFVDFVRRISTTMGRAR